MQGDFLWPRAPWADAAHSESLPPSPRRRLTRGSRVIRSVRPSHLPLLLPVRAKKRSIGSPHRSGARRRAGLAAAGVPSVGATGDRTAPPHRKSSSTENGNASSRAYAPQPPLSFCPPDGLPKCCPRPCVAARYHRGTRFGCATSRAMRSMRSPMKKIRLHLCGGAVASGSACHT
jgi:hypothetical protein